MTAAMTVRDAARLAPVRRLSTRLPWLNFMLGGGFVQGSVVMVHGEPGSGKSTLLAQAASAISGSLYVSAEEDIGAVAARAVRLGLSRDTLLSSESDITAALNTVAPFIVIDSAQTMRPDIITVATACVDHARRNQVCIVLVCHELKGGRFAGPQLLEHLIDCTIKLWRFPRAVMTEKNRYGPAGIALLLEMTETGLHGSLL